MAEKTSIYSALAKCQAKCKLAGKSGKNTFDGYSYAMLEDYIEVIRVPMAENGLSLTVTVKTIERLACRKTKSGNDEQVVQICLQGTLNHESGEQIVAEVYGEGQDRSDKAIYKAITGGKKYLIADLFNIATSDDPEKDSDSERDKAPQNAGKAPSTASNSRPATPPLTTGTGKPAQVPSVKAVNQTLAAKSAPVQTTAPAQTNDERKATGLIGSQQYDTLTRFLKTYKIPGKNWKMWLKDSYGFGSLAEIKVEAFEGIKQALEKNPKIIAEYVTREPGVD